MNSCLRARRQKSLKSLLLIFMCFVLEIHPSDSVLKVQDKGSVRESGEWLVKTWETEDGLPGNSVTAMVQTPDGYLWFGTFNGLVRFDGVKFKVFTPANTPE